MLNKSIILSLILLMLNSCRTTLVNTTTSSNNDNKYDSESPAKSISNNLNQISQSIKKLDIIAFYSTYYFPDSSKITIEQITDSLIEQYDYSKKISHESVSGTATVIYNSNNVIGLLTCAHVIDFSDTLYAYYDDANTYLQAISLKIKQQNHISGLPSGNPLEIIALDNTHDIALLLKETDEHDNKIKPLNVTIGKSKDLQWGSQVYIMGYPLGYLMVTNGLVSINNKLQSGFFVTDALFNHGISGSPVFAIRDGLPNIELVGMATSSSAQQSNFLTPGKNYEKNDNVISKYTGDIFVDNSRLINYGVTFSVTIDEIITFMRLNEKTLVENGFYLDKFF